MTTTANNKRPVATGKRREPRRTASRREAQSSFMTLVEDLRAIAETAPASEWAKLPRDFSENLDHYLYGSPKKADHSNG